jgi:uncharacterized protein
MEPTLEAAITKLFGTQAPATAGPVQVPAQSPPPDSTTMAELARSANEHFTRSQQALRDGDWARYGEEQRLLQDDLRRLSEQAER